MFGPSGFFQSIGDSDIPASSGDLEIIHDSEAGFNILYRASKNGRFFVYKALKPEYRGNPIYEDLLKKDFNIGFSLTHPGICQYYGMVNIPQAGNCIVMDWVDGNDLETLIAEGKVSRSLSIKLIDELCDALQYMHRKQVIHRDLKPENILVTHNGNNVKIIDFGLSDADSYNAFKAPAGTKVYASPELLAGEQIDSRSDIWSLGVLIGEMTGRYAWVVSKCTRRDRDRRYRTADEVRNAVHNAWKRKFLIFLLCLAVASGMIAGGLWLLKNMDLSRSPEAVTLPEPVPAAEPVLPAQEPEVKEEKEPVIVDEPETKRETDRQEIIDAAGLDDLFNQAAGQL